MLGALALICACAASCASVRASHLRAEPWSDGFTAQADDAWQWSPSAALAVAVPLAFALDDEVEQAAQQHAYVTGGDTAWGDALTLALGLGSLGYAWYGEAGAQRAEAAAEALLATAATTQLLKAVLARDRPSGSSNNSFPSGHTSFAFAGAAVFARTIEQETGSRLGYLAFAPALYGGINRVEAERHWPSDVAFGALLGTVLTNWIWNAHFGDGEREAIFATKARTTWRIEPCVDDERCLVGVTWSW